MSTYFCYALILTQDSSGYTLLASNLKPYIFRVYFKRSRCFLVLERYISFYHKKCLNSVNEIIHQLFLAFNWNRWDMKVAVNSIMPFVWKYLKGNKPTLKNKTWIHFLIWFVLTFISALIFSKMNTFLLYWKFQWCKKEIDTFVFCFLSSMMLHTQHVNLCCG